MLIASPTVRTNHVAICITVESRAVVSQNIMPASLLLRRHPISWTVVTRFVRVQGLHTKAEQFTGYKEKNYAVITLKPLSKEERSLVDQYAR